MMYKVKYKLLPSYVVVIVEENETRYQFRYESDQGAYLWSKLSRANKYSDNLNIFIRNIR